MPTFCAGPPRFSPIWPKVTFYRARLQMYICTCHTRILGQQQNVKICAKNLPSEDFRISRDMGRFWMIFRLKKCTEDSFSTASGHGSSNTIVSIGKSSILAIRFDILMSVSLHFKKWIGQAHPSHSPPLNP